MSQAAGLLRWLCLLQCSDCALRSSGGLGFREAETKVETSTGSRGSNHMKFQNDISGVHFTTPKAMTVGGTHEHQAVSRPHVRKNRYSLRLRLGCKNGKVRATTKKANN